MSVATAIRSDEDQATYERGDTIRRQAVFDVSPKQLRALNALRDPLIELLLYGGSKGGGKSIFESIFAYIYAKEIIKFYGMEPQGDSRHLPIIGFMGRKQSVDFSATTLNSWKKIIPASAYRFGSVNNISCLIIEDRAAIQYGGLDDSDTINKFNSAEYAFFCVDQAEECSEEDISTLGGTLRLRFKVGDTLMPPPWGYKGLLTANPAICWLKGAFITSPQPKTKYIQALPSDNPFLEPGYIDRLKRMFAHNPALLNAYLYGSWDNLDQAFTVIKADDILACVENEQHDRTRIKKITVCDVSGEGGDETVIYNMENTTIKKQEIYSHRDLMDSVGRIMAHAKINESNLICVDKVGEGAGVYSRLCEVYSDDDDMTIYGFDGRITAPAGLNEETYKNYKTYAWFKAARMFRERLCDIPNDQTLISQLAGVTFHYTLGDVQMLDKKDDLKKKLRGSPDRADAYVMGLDALEYARPVEVRDRYAKRQGRGYRLSPDAA